MLAQRRITDAATSSQRGHRAEDTARPTTPGNTDLSWTRLTPWRALLAAALDQSRARSMAEVAAERVNPSADLLVAWLKRGSRWTPNERVRGAGYHLGPDGNGGRRHHHRPPGRAPRTVLDSRPPDRPVALKRRETAELLAEELRRLDPDDIYAQTIATLRRMEARKADAKTGTGKSNS